MRSTRRVSRSSVDGIRGTNQERDGKKEVCPQKVYPFGPIHHVEPQIRTTARGRLTRQDRLPEQISGKVKTFTLPGEEGTNVENKSKFNCGGVPAAGWGNRTKIGKKGEMPVKRGQTGPVVHKRGKPPWQTSKNQQGIGRSAGKKTLPNRPPKFGSKKRSATTDSKERKTAGGGRKGSHR